MRMPFGIEPRTVLMLIRSPPDHRGGPRMCVTNNKKESVSIMTINHLKTENFVFFKHTLEKEMKKTNKRKSKAQEQCNVCMYVLHDFLISGFSHKYIEYVLTNTFIHTEVFMLKQTC
jgi:hypothetical protein